MEKIILTDCDGVCVDWNLGFNKFMDDKGYPQLPNTEDQYNLMVRHNITSKQAMEFVKEFNEGHYIADLEPFADSVEYIKKLADLGFRFIAVTSISNSEVAHKHRTKNLLSLFGDVFDEVNCIETGASKSFILQRWANLGYFWIEDHMRQAEAGHEAGLRTVLITHPYNEHYSTDLFPRVSHTTPWEDIYNLICKEYNV